MQTKKIPQFLIFVVLCLAHLTSENYYRKPFPVAMKYSNETPTQRNGCIGIEKGFRKCKQQTQQDVGKITRVD